MHSPVAIFTTNVGSKCPLLLGPDGVGERYYYVASVLCMYVIPLIIILLCYAEILMLVWRKTSAGTESAAAHERPIRQKRKTTRMVFIVVLLFGVCWAPMHSFTLWKHFGKPNYMGYSSMKFILIITFNAFALCLCYSNICVNPFIYAFTTTSFKKHIKKIFAFAGKYKKDEEATDYKPATCTAGYKKLGKYTLLWPPLIQKYEYQNIGACKYEEEVKLPYQELSAIFQFRVGNFVSHYKARAKLF
mgnify:CR=1 FL=1